MREAIFLQIVIGLLLIYLLLDGYKYFISMRTRIYRIMFGLAYLVYIGSGLIVGVFIYCANYSAATMGLSTLTILAMGLFVPVSGYFLTKAKILNADYQLRKYNIPLPEDYKWWVESKKIIKVFLLISLVTLCVGIVYEITNWNHSIILQNWNNTIEHGKLVINS